MLADDLLEAPVERPQDVASQVKIYGQPLQDLPSDLYIPPDALAVMLEAFEGPLDLLLYLIRKANVDVLDIPMAPLTAQYLQYVEVMRKSHLELAAEYLVMAAVLIEIKSRMLLPKPPSESEDEGEDPRAELVRRLIEYEQMKSAARNLDGLDQAGRDFAWVQVCVEKTLLERFPEVSVEDLQQAWQQLLQQAKLHQHHQIRREELSVREHMAQILRQLNDAAAAGRSFVRFEQFYRELCSVPLLVVNFLAMLELAREQLIGFSQTEAFAPIYVSLGRAEIAEAVDEGLIES